MIEIELLEGVSYCEICDELRIEVFVMRSYSHGSIFVCKRCLGKLDWLAGETIKRPREKEAPDD